MHSRVKSKCNRKKLMLSSMSIYDCFGKIINARCKTSAVMAAMFIFANTVTFAAPQTVDVDIYDGDKFLSVVSVNQSVKSILASNGIKLGDNDMVNIPLDSYVKNSQVIVIKRVKNVVVNDGGIIKEYTTSKNTVGEFFEEAGIKLGFFDMVSSDVNSKIFDGCNITITRVVKTTVSVDEPIPFRTITEKNYSINEGETIVVKNGVDGVLTKKYDVYLTNGVETGRVEVSSEVSQQPMDKIVCVGAKPKPGNPPKYYSKVLTCTATAYDLSFQSCGKRPGDKGYGITATGTHAKYGTVAVDPRVIPLGSKLYIETSDGKFVYGYATAEDTGGAIKGNKVDLFFPTNSECMSFGRRSVKVYILD